MSSMRKMSAVALAVIALPIAAWAQVDSARVAGTVADPSGAFVSGAKVTLTNEKAGETRTAETNPEGFFLVPGLKPSTYTIKVEQPGFAALEYHRHQPRSRAGAAPRPSGQARWRQGRHHRCGLVGASRHQLGEGRRQRR